MSGVLVHLERWRNVAYIIHLVHAVHSLLFDVTRSARVDDSPLLRRAPLGGRESNMACGSFTPPRSPRGNICDTADDVAEEKTSQD